MITIIKTIITKPEFWAILIPSFVAILTFWKTKEAEREAEWRKEKLRIYLNFIESLSGITDSEKNDEGEINFARACNNLHSLAPISVLNALHKYQNEMRISNPNPNPELTQKALDSLVYEMRKDMKIKPIYNKNEFEMLLWTSGKKKKTI